ncbi:ABC-2 type transporter [Apiospora arundinis]|uniref:ABC-2 type transporter n=1 Tax=Apiospora arundinis TaxID=335852 RepID=A0ABR2HZ77_9PEZI
MPDTGSQHELRPIQPAPETFYSSTTDLGDSDRVSNGSTPQLSYLVDESERRELGRVASRMSRASTNGALTHLHGFNAMAESDPRLNPEKTEFDVGRWLKIVARKFEVAGFGPKHTGVRFQNLDVLGSGDAVQTQGTVSDIVLGPFREAKRMASGRGGSSQKKILRNFNGLLENHELLIVLGRPGSGCSTLLKTLSGELHGLKLGDKSKIDYSGVSQTQMLKEFKGELQYNQEVDKHFPHLTVGQTLRFAAASRAPANISDITGLSRDDSVNFIAQVVMAMCGLSHTVNTRVGNDFIRGVSGGERKRVSIAEMMVASSSLGAWDNSTRGLDSATALKFVQALRLSSDLMGAANAVAIYQASQSIYELFDKATVLYEGHQIYFGPASRAKAFFERQGWYCDPRQTTGDFLTSVTNPSERKAVKGMENRVPRTPAEFEKYWLESDEYKQLEMDIARHELRSRHGPDGNITVKLLREEKHQSQAKYVRKASPYLVNVMTQIKLTTIRAYQRMWNDMTATASGPIMNMIIALIIGSIYYGSPNNTDNLSSKGAVIFTGILLSALSSINEINTLYSQRPIVEKQASYTFYHPFAEALAGIFADIPLKFVTITLFDIVLYFFSGLRYEAGPFFIFLLFTFVSSLAMSTVFRTMAAVTKTVSQAMSLAGVLVLALVIYTGYVIAVPQMHPWFSWIRFINPIFYGFEALIANEFHNRNIPCSTTIPSIGREGDSWICSVVGAEPGQDFVTGDAYIATNYSYYYSHLWRNFGIMIAFWIAFLVMYAVATEINSATDSTAETLVFQRGHIPDYLLKEDDEESGDSKMAAKNSVSTTQPQEGSEVQKLEAQRDIFTWKDVTYTVKVKNEDRQLLDNVNGWVKPGTLTALMGVSGAGKTTLLDVLAKRTTMGVISGDMLVNGKPLDASFQRKTGYVQQQDLHLETATVRESLRFSATLRQPQSVSQEDKFAYVESVIDMLNMRDFANAVVGVPGDGLNVEQRKLLTIGVELAAKPKLLLFLDEPTSGLDSQSAWAICAFLRKLADAGQAVLCTIHQPSAVLFQEFDRLLFLAKGGKTVYFGDIGSNSRTLLDYFEGNGARKCEDTENPAEYMLDVVNNMGLDWHATWNNSPEAATVIRHLDEIHEETSKWQNSDADNADTHLYSEFAAPLSTQVSTVTTRVFQQYWRTPSHIFAKCALSVAAGLFIGFSFWRPPNTLAGMSVLLFGVFMITTIFQTLVGQIQPFFVTQRSLYEVREKPSKAYSWKAFIAANILVEIPYQIFAGLLLFACVYYPVASIQSSDRQILVLLYIIQFFIYAGTVAQMTVAAMPDTQSAGAIVTLLVMMSLMFCGVLQSPANLAASGFWIFMYRASPFTYWIGGIVATELHGRAIECAPEEMSVFSPPAGQTCGSYMKPYLAVAPGKLQNPDATADCNYCSLTVADQFMAGVGISWDDRWRNFGIVWAYVIFNMFMTVLVYYVFRVHKWGKRK